MSYTQRIYRDIGDTTSPLLWKRNEAKAKDHHSHSSTSSSSAVFPQITILDMARAHALFLDHAGLRGKLHSVIGGSMGGMQAVQVRIKKNNIKHFILEKIVYSQLFVTYNTSK